MENLLLYPSVLTPFIYGNADRGELLIVGISIPKDVMSIVTPTEKWIQSYLDGSHRSLSVYLDLFYFNTPSSLMITGILMMLSRTYEGKRSNVSWYYYSDDGDMMDEGEDYQKWSKCPFTLVEETPSGSFSAARTDRSPLVYIDSTGDFIIHGNSLLDNPLAFYRPIIKWLSSRLLKPEMQTLTLDIHLGVILPSNEPYVNAIIQLLEAFHQQGVKVKILWNYADRLIESFGEKCLDSVTAHYFFKQRDL